ncbi:MAG: glycosyltransferase [Candidatus Marsarchaeota archaeon]|nr:glycosyltransferase [Candidatus Marsarchaeota archaeon]
MKSDKKINVAIVGLEGDFKEDIGEGIQLYIYEIYKNLQRFDDINVTKKEYKVLFGSFGYAIKKLMRTLSFGLSFIFDSFKNIDIVHNITTMPTFKPRLLRKYILITTIHDFNAKLDFRKFGIEDKQRFKESLRGSFVMLIIKLNLKFTDYVIAISEQTKNECIDLGFSKDKIYVVNSALRSIFKSELLKKKKDNNIFKVGYIGAFTKRKNVSFAVEACMKVKGRDFEFLFYGKENQEQMKLKEIARSDSRIKFMGFAPEDQLIKIYDSFDVFVFPSVYEGFGLEPLEAQARGIPVVIYKNSMIPNEVRKYCLEAESPEHMAQIIEDLKKNGYNEKLRKEAMNYARSFTWDNTISKIVDVYKDLLKRKENKI